KESTGPRLSQLCPPCATPFSKFSLDYRRNDARIVENGFAASSGVSKSAKVVLGRVLISHPSMSAFRQNRTLSRHRRMTECDPTRTSATSIGSHMRPIQSARLRRYDAFS